jgi:hypothetical protein
MHPHVAFRDLVDLDADQAGQPALAQLLEGLDVERHYLPACSAT